MAARRQSQLSILLLGKTGAGKSSTGNSILGREYFEDNVGESVTKECKQATVERDGVRVTVIDTPGLCDTEGLDAVKVIDDYIAARKCELHAICLMISSLARPTIEEKEAVKTICTHFGPAMLEYLFIVVTSAENLERKRVMPRDFILPHVTSETDALHLCIAKNRVFGIDNFDEAKRKRQVQELLNGVQKMVKENKGALYTLRHLEENKKKLEEEARKIKEEKEKLRKLQEELQRQEMEAKRQEIREEERRKLEAQKEAQQQAEQELRNAEANLKARQHRHNENAERIGLLETIGRGVLAVGRAAVGAVKSAADFVIDIGKSFFSLFR